MQKSLADLKRNLSLGTLVTLTYAPWEHKFKDLPRYVVKVKSGGIELSPDQDATKGSFLDYPRASLTTFKDNTFSIHTPIKRPLTTEEKAIMDNQPSRRPENQKQVETDMMSDGSQMFYADKRYFKDLDAQYLEGHETVRGLRYCHNDKLIEDESIAGDIEFTYEITPKP